MKIEERVPAEVKKRLCYNSESIKKRRKKYKQKERLTRQDIEELMDVNRPTYKRVRGAVRRK